MTYNVFSGTLNPTQSINLGASITSFLYNFTCDIGSRAPIDTLKSAEQEISSRVVLISSCKRREERSSMLFCANLSSLASRREDLSYSFFLPYR